jgi:hypothetical protein
MAFKPNTRLRVFGKKSSVLSDYVKVFWPQFGSVVVKKDNPLQRRSGGNGIRINFSAIQLTIYSDWLDGSLPWHYGGINQLYFTRWIRAARTKCERNYHDGTPAGSCSDHIETFKNH